jgi:hypothetical protein
MTIQTIHSTRRQFQQFQQTPRKPGDIVLGNATRPAMIVAENGQLVERSR